MTNVMGDKNVGVGLGVGRKMEKMLQLLGYLAVGSFLHVYMKKAKPRPKWWIR